MAATLNPMTGLAAALFLASCARGESTDLPPLARAARATASAEIAPARRAPRVLLSGEFLREPEVSRQPVPRVYAKARKTWIFAAPRATADKIGYLRTGASTPTQPTSAGIEGCPAGWRLVEPRGYVCIGASATLDAHDPVVRATLESPPDFGRRLPYIYGTVRRSGPVYDRLPSASLLATAEPELERRMQTWLSASGEIGASYAQHVWLSGGGSPPDPAIVWRDRASDAIPSFLAGGATLPDLDHAPAEPSGVVGRMRPRAGYSFLRTFLWEGRRYGLTADLTVAPTDRFRPIQGSDFHGVELGKGIDFPFAFVRHPEARFYEYRRASDSVDDGGPAPYRAAIGLTGKQNFFRGRLHFETKDGRWLSDAHASRVDPAKRMPAWGKNGEKWLDINLTKQTLVAYDGERPVFATLISSGEAGLEDAEHTTATKRGIFRIHTKHVSSTMASNEAGEAFELRDVPYVQYFDQGYALHGAYWHDRFGTPKSHGCINLSPEDARRLFFFTEPALPEGWHGVLLPLRGTVVFVHP